MGIERTILEIFLSVHTTDLFEYFYGEDQGRYVVEIEAKNLNKIQKLDLKNSTFYSKIQSGYIYSMFYQVRNICSICT